MRVTQAHLDARRQQIIDAARRCFSQNGFHATSMQDVLREAGLSAGAVYRYFPGKADLISAIVHDSLGMLAYIAAEIRDMDPPPRLDAAISGIIAAMVEHDPDGEQTRVAVQAWSEALRSPVCGAEFTRSFAEVQEILVEIAAACQARGELAGDVRPHELGPILLALLPGFILQRALLPGVTADAFEGGLHALFGGSLPPAWVQAAGGDGSTTATGASSGVSSPVR